MPFPVNFIERTMYMSTNDLRRRGQLSTSAILRDWRLYVMLILPLAFYIIFCYKPMLGVGIAFTRYNPVGGMWKSKWIGLDNFKFVMKMPDFPIALGNTLLLNFMGMIAGFPVPIILAIMLNEIRATKVKKVSQTLLYLPHFLSWVIIASVALNLFKPETGLINILLKNAGWIEEGIPFLTEKWHWAVTYLLIGVWQNMGWGSIIYLAAITGIDAELYEAATIDGAGRLRKIWSVTLPCIRGTMVTLLIMNLGRVMGSNFERLDSFGNVQVKDFQYQLAIYIYEKGLAGSNFSRATAVGLFQSLTGLLLVLGSDWVSKRLGEDGLL